MTFVGFFAVFFMIIITVNKKLKLLIDPMFYMMLMFLFFFGIKDKVIITEKTELILLLTFIIFFFTAYLSRRMEHKRIIKYIANKNKDFWRFEIKKLSKNQEFFLFLLVFIYLIYDYSFNIWLYGSFDKAVTRFYYRLPEKDDVPTFLSIIQFSLYSVSSLVLFILSYNKARFNSSALFLNLTFVALVIAAFPRGTRGAIISLIIIMILAKIIADFRLRKFSLKKIFMNSTVILPLILVVLSFLALSSIRNKEIDNFDVLQKTIAEMDFSNSQKEYSTQEGDLLLTDVNLTIETFGTKVEFLPIYYTLKAVLFNPIPRSLWKDKPVGFGVALTEVKFNGNNFNYEHLSQYKWSNAAGVAGEGWANSGIFGVILYSILMGYYAGILMKIVDVYLLSDNYVSLSIALLAFLGTLITVRGDILSGITQGVYPFLFLLIILTLITPLLKYKWK